MSHIVLRRPSYPPRMRLLCEVPRASQSHLAFDKIACLWKLLISWKQKTGPQAMETNEPESSQELRSKTDKSLEDERGKTDEYLEQKIQTVEEETSETIRLNRLAADKDRESQRAEVDLDKEHQLDVTGIQTSRLDDQSLIQERERSDKAQNVERKEEDHARTRERFQKRLTAEALLENERRETDSNLLEERVRIDLESEHTANLLSDETASHDLTRAALVTRDQIMAIVSHDLQNSIAAISIGAHLIRRGLSKDAADTVSLLENLGMIEQGAAGMDRLISELLDVERMAQDKLILKPERVDLRAYFTRMRGPLCRCRFK